MKGKLVLEDGSVFHGELVDGGSMAGEVVFNTVMAGYQEILTDPSYSGQIVTLTYPLIGNYGVAELFEQSARPSVHGLVISELRDIPNNYLQEGTLRDYLVKNNIPCIYDVDTRAITRKIRTTGTMRGVIAPETATQEEIDQLFAQPLQTALVEKVTTKEAYAFNEEGAKHVVVMDFGVKKRCSNIWLSKVSK